MTGVWEFLLGVGPRELLAVDWSLRPLAEYGPYARFALLLAAVGLGWLVVRSYRREGDLPRRARLVLVGVRMLLLLLALAVLLRPAVVLHYSRPLYSTVGLLIDDSLSMSLADAYAAPQVADAPVASESEPHDAAASLAGGSPAAVSRRDLLAAALRRDGVVERLRRDHDVALLAFSTDAPGREAYTRRLALFPAGEDGPADLDAALARLTASGYETDLATALRDGLERLRGQRVAGLVLLGDGRVTRPAAGDGLSGAIAYAEQLSVPLHTVLVGDPTPPRNLAVTSLQAPAAVRRDAECEFVATLAHRGLAGREVEVRLQRRRPDEESWTTVAEPTRVTLADPDEPAGDADLAPAAADLAAGQVVQEVPLTVRPDEQGEFVYRAVAEPLPDERSADDNAAEARVSVLDDKIRVLLVSGDAGKEFRFLRDLLFRQVETFRLSVWQQNADVEVNQLASTGMKLTRLPRALAELVGSPGDDARPGYDVVILYDPQPTEGGFDDRFCALLDAFVTRHGGGLCYVASNKHSEAVLRNPIYQPLAELLPVELASDTVDVVARISRGRPRPWPVELTTYGPDHPITRLAASDDANRAVWQRLGGIFWSHPVYRSKPAARVLAASSDPTRRTSDQEPQPLLATQAVGTGRVVYVGFDETWRWRRLDDARWYRTFWLNLVRYLATLRARQVVITTGAETFRVGEDIPVEAEAYDEDFQPLAADELDVEMIDTATGGTRTLRLPRVEDSPGRYRLTLRAERTGTFLLTALAGDPQQERKVAAKRIAVTLPTAETRRTEADADTLRRIASRPENFLQLGELDRLPELIGPSRLQAATDVPREIWDTPLTLAIFVALLTAEWILRKRHNLT